MYGLCFSKVPFAPLERLNVSGSLAHDSPVYIGIRMFYMHRSLYISFQMFFFYLAGWQVTR
jgi:hypothetical protein